MHHLNQCSNEEQMLMIMVSTQLVQAGAVNVTLNGFHAKGKEVERTEKSEESSGP